MTLFGKVILAAVLGFALGRCGLEIAEAQEDQVSRILGCSTDPCVIKSNRGGSLAEFRKAALAIAFGARSHVVVDGVCASACTVAIDEIPTKVCLTTRARLRFHLGTTYALKWTNVSLFGEKILLGPYSAPTFFVPSYSAKIQAWIDSVGGLPNDGSMIEMPITVAWTIWPLCPIVLPHVNAHGLY